MRRGSLFLNNKNNSKGIIFQNLKECNRMKKYGIITVLILTLFIWPINSCIKGVSDIPVAQESIFSDNQAVYSQFSPNTSFHGVTTGENTNWYIVKFYAASEIKVDELCIKYKYRSENYNGVDWWGRIITNFTWTKENFATGEFMNESERFFHFEFGNFNDTYDKRDTLNKNHSRRSREWNFYIPSGTWYLICYTGPSVTSKIEVYLNITGDVEFLSTSEGSNVHVLIPEDFLGNINVKIGYYAVGVLNGKTSITVNHTLLCIHNTISGWGYEQLRCTSPTGDVKNFMRIFWKNKEIRIPDTLSSCFFGEAGTWRFELNSIQWGGIFNEKYWWPGYGVSLFIADIELP